MNVPPRPNPPWSPSEKLELLTEILKQHNLHPDNLLHLVRGLPQPSWDDIALPRGRTLNQARALYREYVLHSQPIGPVRGHGSRDGPGSIDLSLAHQQYPLEGPYSAPASHTRYPEIQPRPANLTSGLATSPSSEPPRKKRGRPTKAESELRREAARARQDPPVLFKRESTHMAPTLTPASVAAAQAVMGPSQMTTRTNLPPEAAAKATRKRPLSQEPDSISPTKPSEEELGGSHYPHHHMHERQPSRDYPEILTQDPVRGPSTFRAPRGE